MKYTEPGVHSSFVAPGFENVLTAFTSNFEKGLEVGSSFAAYRRGDLIVDLAAGVADPVSLTPYTRDTVTLSFSGTKGFVAMCIAVLIDRGQLDLESPVAQYWPEFAQHDKGSITVKQLVTHQARLPGIDTPVSFEDIVQPVKIARILAAQAPSPDPRAGFCYHALTFGWLCAELIRQIDGRSIGTFFREEVAAPLGAEVWIGVPSEILPRVSHLIPDPEWISNPALNGERFSEDPLFRSILANPPILDPGDYRWNSRVLRQAEMPASNGAGTAVGIATLYAGFPSLVSPETLTRVTSPLKSGFDETYNSHSTWGAGFAIDDDTSTRRSSDGGYGHSGNGGSVHGYWPAAEVSYSYLPNLARKLNRGESILDALSAAL